MTLATLSDVLQPALNGSYAVAGLVCLGWEDMRAYVAAAEAENVAVILQAGPGCRQHTPLPVLGKMFTNLAENASVPVVAHLDHGYTFDECKQALESGFTSLMYDGSRKPIDKNIEETAAIVALAHGANISCEGEIGFVGYAGSNKSAGEKSTGTDPVEAARFARETGVDAMAISVGNVHLQQQKHAGLDVERIAEIEALSDVPLVIHGGSGVSVAQRQTLAAGSKICKFNIGTELRMAFGAALRQSIMSDPARFDRNVILADTHEPMVATTRQILRYLGAPEPG
jgi:fructose-bisphosphate aldolase class II